MSKMLLFFCVKIGSSVPYVMLENARNTPPPPLHMIELKTMHFALLGKCHSNVMMAVHVFYTESCKHKTLNLHSTEDQAYTVNSMSELVNQVREDFLSNFNWFSKQAGLQLPFTIGALKEDSQELTVSVCQKITLDITNFLPYYSNNTNGPTN
jgi:hypothetical protein